MATATTSSAAVAPAMSRPRSLRASIRRAGEQRPCHRRRTSLRRTDAVRAPDAVPDGVPARRFLDRDRDFAGRRAGEKRWPGRCLTERFRICGQAYGMEDVVVFAALGWEARAALDGLQGVESMGPR